MITSSGVDGTCPLPARPASGTMERCGGSICVALATLVAPVTVIVVVLLAMHPLLLLTNSTTTGGDTGSHVAVAAFMRTNLLPNFHLTGWDPDGTTAFRSSPSTSRSPTCSPLSGAT